MAVREPDLSKCGKLYLKIDTHIDWVYGKIVDKLGLSKLGQITSE
jgi:hypothetical protein